ncbi:hypothetical protein V6N13_072453 [Hibiscus sabdariffa]
MLNIFKTTTCLEKLYYQVRLLMNEEWGGLSHRDGNLNKGEPSLVTSHMHSRLRGKECCIFSYCWYLLHYVYGSFFAVFGSVFFRILLPASTLVVFVFWVLHGRKRKRKNGIEPCSRIDA